MIDWKVEDHAARAWLIAEVFGTFPGYLPDAQRQLVDKIRTYHLQTEAFDRTLDGREFDGIWFPCDAERGRSNLFAVAVCKQLGLNLSSRDFREANKLYVNSGQLDRDLAALPWPRRDATMSVSRADGGVRGGAAPERGCLSALDTPEER